MFRPHFDLPLRNDGSQRFLPLIVALMVYLASLAMGGLLVVHDAVGRWDRGLSGTFTVELPPAPDTGKDDGAVESALTVLRKTPGVESAEPLGFERTAKLLAPWLGASIDAGDLPLPRLIDVKVDPRAGIDTAALGAALAAAVPKAVLDDHRRWLDRVIRAALALETVAAIVVGLVALAAILAVVFATRTGLAVHHATVEVLHLIGARDRYIARQFERHALRLGLRGGFIGLLFAALTFLGIAAAAAEAGVVRADIRFLPALSAPPAQWALLLLLPPAAGIIAMATARITVLRSLRRMP